MSVSKRTVQSFEQFRSRFLRVLESYYRAEATVALILKNEAHKKQCAALLWLCVNDSRDRLARLTKRRQDFWISLLEDGVRGTKALEFIYRDLDRKPHLAEFMSTIQSDVLVKQQAVQKAFASAKAYGRDLDWSIALYAKTELESRLGKPVSNQAMADLLNAACQASGRKLAGQKKEFFEDDVRVGLGRLQRRTFERVLPYYRRMLAEHYPHGDLLKP